MPLKGICHYFHCILSRDFEWYIPHYISCDFQTAGLATTECYLLSTCDFHFPSQGRAVKGSPTLCARQDAVHTRKKQCVHGCVHQTLAGTAKENVFQPRPDLFVSFVTLLYSGLINGPSAGIWHQPSGLSEPRSTHVGNQEKVWCK